MSPMQKGVSVAHKTENVSIVSIYNVTRLAVILSLTLFIAGCRTAPDLHPFADATSQLAGSIKTTGRTVTVEIDSMSAKWEKDQRERAMDLARRFNQEWTHRNALADALLEYSASLTAIAQAGEQGEASARAVATSFNKLCNSIDVALPQAVIADQAVQIGSMLYGKFARDHAAKTLGESMQKLQPSIDETAAILGNSLRNIETGLDAIRDQNAQNIEDEMLDGIKVRTERNNLKVLSERRAALLAMLNAGTQTRDTLRKELLSAFDQNKQTQFEHLTTLNVDITSELTVVEASLKTESEKLAPIDSRKSTDRDRLTTQITLVRTVRLGLDDWAAAHSRLAAAALENKPLQVDDLVQTAIEIRTLVTKVRTTNKE